MTPSPVMNASAAPVRRRTVTVEGRFRIALLFSCILSLLVFGVAEPDLVLAGAMILAAIVGWTITEHSPGKGLPRWATTILLTAMLVALCIRTWSGTPPVSAFATFLSAIMVIKLWERRVLRDYGQMLTIALFLMVGAVLTSNSVLVGVVLMILIPMLVVTVLLFQLHVGASRATSAPAPIPWRNARPALWRTAFFTMVVGGILATIFFVTIPRGVGLLGEQARRELSIGRSTGFVEEVHLGEGGLISQSPAQVMDVRYTSDDGLTQLGNEGQVLYLRAIVLSRYQNGRWLPADRARRAALQEVRDPGQALRLAPEPAGRSVVRLEVYPKESLAKDGPLFLLYRPITIESDSPGAVRFEYDPREAWVRRLDGPMRSDYVVRAAPLWEPRHDGDVPVENHARESIDFPIPTVKALAEQVVRDAGIQPKAAQRPEEQDISAARAIESYLRTHYTYTLQLPGVPLDTDPTEFFLFQAKRGHCEYFASALAGMCRAVGVNARVVGGYLASEFDPSRGLYVVRAWNAHAWVEVRAGAGRWRTLDATPPADLVALHTGKAGWLGSVQSFFERIQDAWNTSVVSFDESSQARLLGHRGPGGLTPVIDDWVSSVRSLWYRFGRHVRTSILAGLLLFAYASPVLVLAIVMWRLVVRHRRHTREKQSGWAFDESLAKARTRLLKVLAAKGYVKPEWMPLSTFARSLAHSPNDADSPGGASPAWNSVLHAAEALERAAFNVGDTRPMAVTGVRDAIHLLGRSKLGAHPPK